MAAADVHRRSQWSRASTGPDVFFDIDIDGSPAGRIIFRLYDTVCPLTARNFRELATGVNGYGYAHSAIHRVVPNFMIQGGDIVEGNGTTGRSIYGPTFADESFRFPHDRPGLLSMANRGPHTNSSQVSSVLRSRVRLDLYTHAPSPRRSSANLMCLTIAIRSLQFFVTTVAAPWCDGRNVVFGEVIRGMNVVRKIESYASDHILYKPSVDIVIVHCGTL
ncbi:hypothetical protein ONZ51_g4221 [Trametes cubensis]|uniref:Peptidyl-prolyl cis-trans isomerase n=1 Tax=Trametes cubensis TaxID=1111947 RepID=A0AAD7XD68_9APHY|nr:hypothetical protein ONZ51_g4221 [Trametes cubensis]